MGFLTQPITLQSLFGKNRRIGSIDVNVVVSESTNEVLTITKQPVQTGASITDHAYKEPTTFSMQILFEDNLFLSLSKVYQDLLKLQSDRAPIDVVTPKRIYTSMLISALGMTTDKHTENCLSIAISFQEIIIVAVSTTTIPRSRQRLVRSTQKTQQGGRRSAGLSLAQGVNPSVTGFHR